MTRILIGPKQREEAPAILDKKIQHYKKNSQETLILHLFDLDLTVSLSNLFLNLLKHEFCQRIKIERCNGIGLSRLLQVCIQDDCCAELELQDLEDFQFPMIRCNGKTQLRRRLDRLSMTSMSLNASAGAFIAATAHSIYTLQLKNCQLQDTTTTEAATTSNALIQALEQGPTNGLLQNLDLSHCQMSESTMVAVLKTILSTCLDTLTELDISHNDLSGNEAISLLTKLIRESKQLQKLHSSNIIRTTTTESIRPLANALARNMSLQFWNFSGNQLRNSKTTTSTTTSTTTMGDLAMALVQNKTLTTLYLHDNHLDDSILDPILKVWQQWTCLRTLWIFQNPLSVAAIGTLSQAFARNQTTLYDLQVPKVSFLGKKKETSDTDPQQLVMQYQQEINYWANLNRHGRYLVRQAEEIPLGLWPLVLARNLPSSATTTTSATKLLKWMLQNSTSTPPTESTTTADVIYHFLHVPAVFLHGGSTTDQQS